MTRRGQIHPVWVQEGLCSLMEDYDFLPDGSLTPAHSWRTTTAKRLLSTGTLPSLSTLTAMSREAFSQNRPLTNYALARTLFLYLYDQGKLAAFYSALCSTLSEDPTGTLALERTLGKPIADINTDFRASLRSTPDIPEQITSGMASLGVEITAGTGEGPIVTLAPAGSPLRSGDILVAIGLHPVRDIPELIRLLSRHSPGDTVQLTLRRGKTRLTLDLPLVAK
jgi:C-terminal processing protease CtpA/Prc